jgi:hypothetical protein
MCFVAVLVAAPPMTCIIATARRVTIGPLSASCFAVISEAIPIRPARWIQGYREFRCLNASIASQFVSDSNFLGIPLRVSET